MWVAERCGRKGTGYFIFLTEASLCHIWRAIAVFKWLATCVCQIQVIFQKSDLRWSYVALENFTELAFAASFPLFSEKKPHLPPAFKRREWNFFPPLYMHGVAAKIGFFPPPLFFSSGKGGGSAGRGNLPNLNISFPPSSAAAKKLEASA